MSLPSGIVARWVRAVELEALDCVPAGIHQIDSEGAAATHLRVDVLLVGQVADELFDVDGRALAVDVALAMKAAHVNQHVCVGNDTRNGNQNVVVHLVQLSTLASRHEEG